MRWKLILWLFLTMLLFYFSQKPFTLFSSSKSYYFLDLSLCVSIMAKIPEKNQRKMYNDDWFCRDTKSSTREEPIPTSPLSLQMATGAALLHTATCVMSLMRADSWVGPWSLKFFGPQMVRAYRLDVISQGPKNSRFPGPNPLPLALVMYLHASKTLRTGPYKS